MDSIRWVKQHLGDACVEERVEGDQPLLLVDRASAYVALAEHHQLFCVDYDGQEASGRREHLATCKPGQLLFGLDKPKDQGNRTALLMSGVTGSVVWKIPVAKLLAARDMPGGAEVFDALFDGWIRLLVGMLPTAPVPTRARAVGPGEALDAAGDIRAQSGLVWIHKSSKPTRYLALDLGEESDVAYWPITEEAWATCDVTNVLPKRTIDLFRDHGSGAFADDFHAFVLGVVGKRRASLAQTRLDLDLASRRAEEKSLSESLGQLALVGSGQRLVAPAATGGDLAKACASIAQWLRIPAPHVVEPSGTGLSHMQRAMSRITGVRTRPVLLERDWWRHDAGALLGFLQGEGEDAPLRPIALLPSRRGYELHDPTSATPQHITKELAETVHPQAHQFYAPLPDTVGGPIDVFRFASRRARADLAFVIGLGMTVGAIGMLLPLLTAQVFDRIIPGAERGLLFQLGLVLIAFFFGQTLFDFARGLRIVRAQTRMDVTLEAAMWDRLLALPLPFFRQYTAGDLAARAGGIGAIREVLSGAALTVLLSGFFSLWNVVYLFAVDVRLALAGCALVAVAGAVAAGATWFGLRQQRIVAELDGKIGGLLLQLLGGIAKLRVTGSENRAFGVWARLFARRRDADLASAWVNVRVTVFQAMFPLACTLTLYWLVMGMGSTGPHMTTGQFLAFSTAFNIFLSSVLDVLGTVLQSLVVVPLYERAKPILMQRTETYGASTARIALSGAIEVSHVSFSYAPDGPKILDDVSLKIGANEFVAIVGTSGSGKSTLLRIMLGFETCTEGGVFYDEQALTGLDIRVVRQQIGVVTQNSRVMAGDIYSNIVGNTGLSIDDAWRAARQAAFDKDIEAMPMGMHTVISQGGGTLSGGQRQRLLIARSLVSDPRILFFDEATSALDNVTQAIVSESLEGLRVTRIAIAHRLSTIRRADKIVVLEGGRVVQQGKFEELMEQEGAFRKLAKRQTV
jgi:ATP-binding cassette subfamily C protein